MKTHYSQIKVTPKNWEKNVKSNLKKRGRFITRFLTSNTLKALL